MARDYITVKVDIETLLEGELLELEFIKRVVKEKIERDKIMDKELEDYIKSCNAALRSLSEEEQQRMEEQYKVFLKSSGIIS